MKNKVTSKLPFITIIILGVVSLFLTLKGVFNYFFLITGQFLTAIPMFILFGDPTQPNIISFVILCIPLIVSWLFSTKYPKFQTKRWRLAWFTNMMIGILFNFLWLITAPVYNVVLPYMSNRAEELYIENVWQAILIGDLDMLLLVLMLTPTIIVVVLLFWMFGQYQQYAFEFNEAFFEFEYKNVRLQKWFNREKQFERSWPDVVLGPETESRELLIQPGRDRTLNNIIVGSIGTGKTSALVLPIINQDLHWMTRFINDYPEIYQREDFHTEKVKGMYLNGISIIEPSNDLCQKAFQLVKAHGIPEESVFYIDPTNKNTPSINPMKGNVEQVAEAFAMVMEGLAEGGTSNFFFQQSERNHLKHYIYLLKLHNPKQEVTFDMLLKMYDNAQLVRKMHLALKDTIPSNYEEIEDRDERNHWAIVKQVDEWFDTNLQPRVRNNAPVKITHGEYRGENEYYDAKAEYVQGLRNVLNDIGASPLIRRVLFGKSNFDFDRHLEMGGVLLVNTAKGELGGLSNVLGKLILLSLQNAVFRRKPNISTFHHILVDEFPDYVYRPFKEFPAQSRKYKTVVTVVLQTVTQLADKYGETYMHTLLGTLRHKMVYGDIPDFDAQLFSKIFGEEEKFEESVNEQSVSPLQEDPMLRKGNTYQKVREAILSPSDIIYQEPFQCAVKIVSNNKPIPVKQIDANFVPKEEFEQAIIQVDEEAAELWLLERSKVSSEMGIVQEGIESDPMEEDTTLVEVAHALEETQSEEATTYEKESDYIFISPSQEEHQETSVSVAPQIETPNIKREERIETVSLSDLFPSTPKQEEKTEKKHEERDLSTVAQIGKEQEELYQELLKEIDESNKDEGSKNTKVPLPYSIYEN